MVTITGICFFTTCAEGLNVYFYEDSVFGGGGGGGGGI